MAQIGWTTDTAYAVSQSDLSFIIVPTPSDKNGSFSNHLVLRALADVAEGLKTTHRYHTVVITSTVMPGSMQQFQRFLEHASGLRMGEDFGLCYNPEFIALGSVIHDLLYPDFVLIGSEDKRSREMLDSFYHALFNAVPPGDSVPRAYCNFVNAEVAKLALNNFVTAKISFANSLADLTEHLPGGDIDQVLGAIGLDSRIGPRYLKAGTPFGGPCFCRDGRALKAAGRAVDVYLPYPGMADEVNHNLLLKLACEVSKRNVPPGTPIAILGLAYKAGTPVTDESTGMNLLEMLVARGYSRVRCHDPLKAPGSLVQTMGCAQVVYYLVPQPGYQGLEGLIQPGTLVIDPWRAIDASRLPEGCCLIAYGVGPNDP